jgi:hypothetical protein
MHSRNALKTEGKTVSVEIRSSHFLCCAATSKGRLRDNQMIKVENHTACIAYLFDHTLWCRSEHTRLWGILFPSVEGNLHEIHAMQGSVRGLRPNFSRRTGFSALVSRGFH